MATSRELAEERRGEREAEVLSRLSRVCDGRGLGSLAARLEELASLTAGDLGEVERSLALAIPDGDVVVRSARHLLALGGKRLRPLCVLLASRIGGRGGAAACELAVAVELVHAATLLHDDVVDLGERRRGAPAARVVYGNAASVFAGDFLLVEALRRVRRARVDGALDRLLDTIDEMIRAEAIQLERRGRITADREAWHAVARGKTAALFRWALFAGARVAGLDEASTRALEAYGEDLGVAFQAVDDVLDVRGDAARTGKLLFTDLREGKMSYPLVIALEREPALLPLLEAIVAAAPDGAPDVRLVAEVSAIVERAHAADASIELSRRHARSAIGRLDAVPPAAATRALVTVAEACVDRSA